MQMEEAVDRDEPFIVAEVQALRAEVPKVVERRELICYDDLFSSEVEEESVEAVPDADAEGESTEEEEVESSSDSSDPENEGLLKAALPLIEKEVKGYDVTALPENGSQFLLKVMHERKQIPKVVNAPKALVEDFDATKPVDDGKPFKVTKVPKCVDMPTTLQEFLPTQSWLSIITHQFSNLSMKVEHWRGMMEEQGSAITLSEGVLMPPGDLDEDKCLLYCFGTNLFNQLKSNPRQRKAVSSADAHVILTFFSDEVIVPMNQHVLTTAEKIAAAEDSMKTLVISSEEDGKSDEAVAPSANNEQNITQDLQTTNGVEDKSSSASSDTEVEVEEEPLFCEKQAPLMSILLNLSIPDVEDLLAMHVLWLNKYGWFHEFQGKWIYALLGCLVRPLSCDVVANIRKLVRICCALRKRVCECKLAASVSKVEEEINKSEDATPSSVPNGNTDVNAKITDTEPSTVTRDSGAGDSSFTATSTAKGEESEENIRFKQFINTMNLFICLASNYFQQFDLADTPRP